MHLGTLNLWYKAASYKPKFIVPQMYFMITRKTPWLLPRRSTAASGGVRRARAVRARVRTVVSYAIRARCVEKRGMDAVAGRAGVAVGLPAAAVWA